MLIEKISSLFGADEIEPAVPSPSIFKLKVPKSSEHENVLDTIEWAQKEGYLESLNINRDNAEKQFHQLFFDQDSKIDFKTHSNLSKELKQVAIDKVKESLPISSTETEQIINLIHSGKILHDIYFSIELIITLIIKPERFLNIDINFKKNLETLFYLPQSIIADINPKTAIDRISNQIELIKSGAPPDDPAILNNTLKTIFLTAEIGEAIDAINALLAPENESIRIALLIYARLNGINLEQQDIDKIRENLFNKKNPNLGGLFLYLLTPENIKRLAGG